MVADESSGAGNEHAHDNGKREKLHHRPPIESSRTVDWNLKGVGGGSENGYGQ